MDIKAKSQRRGKFSAPYHHGNLRAAVVEAGLQALKSTEWQQLSARELARHLGVSSTAAYRHFSNKDALLSAVAAEGLRRLNVAWSKAAEEQTQPGQKLLAAGRAYVQYASDNPSLFRLIFDPSIAVRQNAEWSEETASTERLLKKLVIETGGLEQDDPRVSLRMMAAWAIVYGISRLALNEQFKKASGDKLDDIIDAVMAELPQLSVGGGVAAYPLKTVLPPDFSRITLEEFGRGILLP